MVFNSIQFAVFLLIVFAAYWIASPKYQWCILLAASYLFYAFCSLKYMVLLVTITLLTYAAGIFLEKNHAAPKKKAVCLTVVTAIPLGILFFFKYFNFFSESLFALFGSVSGARDPFLIDLLLPVGISFYTFVAIAYVVDVYKGKIPAETHLGKYALFMSFFPSLLSGPIERADNLLVQIHKPQAFDYDLAVAGLREMLIGYFKKMVVADTLAGYVNAVYGNLEAYTGFSLVLAVVFYTIQIYCDFSGYSDIAIGVSKLFGFRLRENFRYPYFATSIKEFWGRWHISLSSWFRDYVYIPLGGNRVGSARHKLNLMLTFLVSGLWHGASWNFIIWGGIHGAVQVLESLFRSRKQENRFVFFRWIAVMLIVASAWVFFRAESLADALYVFAHCLDGTLSPGAYILGGITAISTSLFDMALTAASIAAFLVFEFFSRDKGFSQAVGALRKPLRWLVYAGLVLLILFLTPVTNNSSFLYFQF